MQAPARLAAPAKGKLMLRNRAQRYKATGFMARPSKSTISGSSSLPLRSLKSANKMPDNFCYTPSELTQVRDQKQCGCCWAVSSTSMLADRVLVKSNFKIRSALSPVQFMECSTYLEGGSPVGCEGNDPFTALQSIKDKPIFLKAESAYPRSDYTTTTSATNCASGSEADQKDYAVTITEAFMVTKEIPEDASEEEKAKLISENVENMKQSLYNEGPLVVVFAVPDDFKDYDGNTIYQAPEGFDYTKSDAWHAVELVGWGKDEASGQSYWVCRNSWGDKWPVVHKKCNGMGFFYIAMGHNECAIEAYAAGATVKVINSDKAPKSPNDVYPGETACTVGRSFFSTPIVGPVTWGEVIVVAAVAGAGYYIWNNHKKTGYWMPEFARKLLA
jgi:C1A family cysteine protease